MPDNKQRRYVGFLVLIILVVVAVGTAFLVPSPTSHSSVQVNSSAQVEDTLYVKELNFSTQNEDGFSTKTPNSSARRGEESYAKAQNSTAQNEDEFYGNIKNVPFKGQTTGVVKADTNCKQVKNGLTNCTAIITTPNGTLHFNYEHDMTRQSCLEEGDRVTIALLSKATVKVVR